MTAKACALNIVKAYFIVLCHALLSVCFMWCGLSDPALGTESVHLETHIRTHLKGFSTDRMSVLTK